MDGDIPGGRKRLHILGDLAQKLWDGAARSYPRQDTVLRRELGMCLQFNERRVGG